MSHPRQVLPGALHLVTRRCAERRLHLRPDPDVGVIFLFCLALAALVTGVRVHAWCLLSNHEHLLVSDPHVQLPRFLRLLDRNVAMCIKVLRRIDENVWSAGEASVVHLTTPQAVLDALLYVLVQPVEAGLVKHPDEWPGTHTELRFYDARPRTHRRPKIWFRRRSHLPESVELTVTMPECLRHLGFTPERFERDLGALLDRRVAEIVAARRAEKKKFLGAAAATSVSAFDSPDTTEPFRKLNPTVKASDPLGLRAAIFALRQFRARYRAALARWRAGEQDVAFPPGTWWMRVFAKVTIAAT